MRLYAFLGFFVATVLITDESGAQDKKHYHITQTQVGEKDKVKLEVNATTVDCRIHATSNTNVVSVYGYPQSSQFHPVSSSISDGIAQNVTLDFKDSAPTDLSSSISDRMLGSFSEESEKLKHPWYIYLNKKTPYDLSLRYGMGSSTVDLSGLAVENLKVNTGSSSLRIGYTAHQPNDVVMDTFYTSVDLGTLELDHLNLARARNVIADIGFGKLVMHFSDDLSEESQVKASIGAGSLAVSFAEIESPIIIRVSDSPLCRIDMPSSFKKIRKGTFVNQFYQEGATNILSFDIDVSIGNVEFTVAD
ncbi:hypothetical protein [Tunicatimonas pelagia]|uniref:hypothetical protein n=1 Tax=Tunicatimonas pelagia TaxID=931531 RepID=UPI002665B910|nr:hypothetical protein [Tunicatimonas pelagia]WKN43693.1 hypothetical protein P0M28_01750 [Tunicatimonas pelagia]